ncbi:unnamed protein product [Lactuca virosa]|uniref:Glycine-rich protein n=1 Tax=Lactuca virosa TaxID=75947 RepID=A0AAU9NRH0_9ASTR|nr:unnamed protein product [Lactuca virosa]
MVLKPIDVILFVLLLCVVDYVCGENLVEAQKNLSGYPEGNSENGCISKTDISCGLIKDIHEEGHQVVNLTGGLDDDIREGLNDYVKESQAEDVSSVPGQIVTLFFKGLFQFLRNVIGDIDSGTSSGGAAGGNNNQGGTSGGGSMSGGGAGEDNQGGTGGGGGSI